MDWDPSQRFSAKWTKHLPVVHVAWEKVVVSTKHGDCHYKSGSPESIWQRELNCVATGKELPKKHPTLRRFWKSFSVVIGASLGKETKIIYVEWHKAGACHGWPITEQELKQKRAL